MNEKTMVQRKKRRDKYLYDVRDNERFYIHESSPSFGEGTERWGVWKTRKKEVRELLITGTGRCGTKFMSKSFQSLGYDLPHEKVGDMGTSSHWFCVDSDWYPVQIHVGGMAAHVGERRSDFNFNHTIHMIRNPFKAINSINQVFRETDYHFLLDNRIIPYRYNPFEKRGKYWRAMLAYYFVNKHIEENLVVDMRLKIEEASKKWYEVMELVGLPRMKPVSIDKPVNTGKQATSWFKENTVTSENLLSVDAEIGKAILEMAHEYNYL